MRLARRRAKLARSTDAIMAFIETEIAKLLGADPQVEAARLRAARRAGRSPRRSGTREATATH